MSYTISVTVISLTGRGLGRSKTTIAIIIMLIIIIMMIIIIINVSLLLFYRARNFFIYDKQTYSIPLK